jgi:hypothetical protein
MYKAYIIGAPEIGAEDEEVLENEGIEGIMKRKEQKLLQVKLELARIKSEVAGKRAVLQVSGFLKCVPDFLTVND